jgi:dTDP-4-dehydrorhamnose 3,5-epimerase-like enzyme
VENHNQGERQWQKQKELEPELTNREESIMIINEQITSPIFIPIQSYNDDRGILIPFGDNIDPSIIRRSYFVQNYGRGVIRGLHYHLTEMKMFTIAWGAAKFITCALPEDVAKRNINEEIKDFIDQNPDNVKSWVLSSRHHGLLVVPKNHANGWIGLEDNTTLFSLSNLTYNEIEGDDIRIDPYILGEDVWQVKGR